MAGPPNRSVTGGLFMRSTFLAFTATCSIASIVPAQVPQAAPPAPAVAPQVVTMASQASPVRVPATSNAVLRVGTEVPVRLLEELTTKGTKLGVGHRFRMEASGPVMVQGVVVIPVGSPVVG